MDRRTRELLAKAAAANAEATAPAKEVLSHLYRAILDVPEITLKDGTKARLDPYIEPEVSEDGQIQCGFDVLLDNGGHLEFMVTNTGWGKAFAPCHKGSLPPTSRGR